MLFQPQKEFTGRLLRTTFIVACAVEMYAGLGRRNSRGKPKRLKRLPRRDRQWLKWIVLKHSQDGLFKPLVEGHARLIIHQRIGLTIFGHSTKADIGDKNVIELSAQQ